MSRIIARLFVKRSSIAYLKDPDYFSLLTFDYLMIHSSILLHLLYHLEKMSIFNFDVSPNSYAFLGGRFSMRKQDKLQKMQLSISGLLHHLVLTNRCCNYSRSNVKVP